MKHGWVCCTGSGPAGPATSSPLPGGTKGPPLGAMTLYSPHRHLAWPRHPAKWDLESGWPQSPASNLIVAGGPFSRNPTAPLLPCGTWAQLGAFVVMGNSPSTGPARCAPGQPRLKESASHSRAQIGLSRFLSSFTPLCPRATRGKARPFPCLATLWPRRRGSVSSLGTVFPPGLGIRPLTIIPSAVTAPPRQHFVREGKELLPDIRFQDNSSTCSVLGRPGGLCLNQSVPCRDSLWQSRLPQNPPPHVPSPLGPALRGGSRGSLPGPAAWR